MVKVFDYDNFAEETKNGVVVVDCYADWCGPCKMLAPVIEQLSEDYAGKVNFGKVDVDNESEIAQQFGIMSIPAVLFFKDGELKEQSIGFKPKAALDSIIQSLL